MKMKINYVVQLTDEEMEIVNLLEDAYDKFMSLPIMQPDDQQEFYNSVHHAQNTVMARVAVRAHPNEFLNQSGL